MHTHINTCSHTNTDIHECMYCNACMSVCLSVCMYVCMHVCMHHVRMYACIHVLVCVYTPRNLMIWYVEPSRKYPSFMGWGSIRHSGVGVR